MLNKNLKKVTKIIAFFSFTFLSILSFFPLSNPVQATSTSDLFVTNISLLKFNPENWKAPTVDASIILSKDGRYVIFNSGNSNLVPSDTNGFSDVFLYDRETDEVELISVSNDGTQGNGHSFVTGNNPISADGRFVVYISEASNLVPNDTNGYEGFIDVFVYDRETKTIERANVSSSGDQEEKFDSDYPPINGNPGVHSDQKKVSISADGQHIAFESYAQNLSESILHSTNPVVNRIFIRDRINHTTEMLTDFAFAESTSFMEMSADGQFVLFGSQLNLVPQDTNNTDDVYLYNVLNHTLELVSVGTGGIVGQAPFPPASHFASMSDDGRYVAFNSYATNFDPQESYYNSRLDVFVYDRELNITRPITSGGNNHSSRPMISPDGRYVVFMSWATNLVDIQTNGQMEVYIYDLQTGQIKLISASIDGIPGNGWNYNSQLYAKNDGLFVLFNSQSTNLVPGDTDSYQDWYIAEVSNYVNHFPTANAGTDQTVNEGQEVVFNGSGSTDLDGTEDIVSYQWDFGDGGSASGINPAYTYYDEGTYITTLTITDTQGETNSEAVTITVNNVAPVLDPLSTISSVLPEVEVSTNAIFTDPGFLDIHTASIDWGDGVITGATVTQSNGSGSIFGSHTYLVPGEYTVVVTVTDNSGGSNSQSMFVTILTPVQATNSMVDLVESYNLQQGIENSLDAKLSAAISALDDLNENNNQATINSLQAFINAVEAQKGDKITNEQADVLTATAQAIINILL